MANLSMDSFIKLLESPAAKGLLEILNLNQNPSLTDEEKAKPFTCDAWKEYESCPPGSKGTDFHPVPVGWIIEFARQCALLDKSTKQTSQSDITNIIKILNEDSTIKNKDIDFPYKSVGILNKLQVIGAPATPLTRGELIMTYLTNALLRVSSDKLSNAKLKTTVNGIVDQCNYINEMTGSLNANMVKDAMKLLGQKIGKKVLQARNEQPNTVSQVTLTSPLKLNFSSDDYTIEGAPLTALNALMKAAVTKMATTGGLGAGAAGSADDIIKIIFGDEADGEYTNLRKHFLDNITNTNVINLLGVIDYFINNFGTGVTFKANHTANASAITKHITDARILHQQYNALSKLNEFTIKNNINQNLNDFARVYSNLENRAAGKVAPGVQLPGQSSSTMTPFIKLDDNNINTKLLPFLKTNKIAKEIIKIAFVIVNDTNIELSIDDVVDLLTATPPPSTPLPNSLRFNFKKSSIAYAENLLKGGARGGVETGYYFFNLLGHIPGARAYLPTGGVVLESIDQLALKFYYAGVADATDVMLVQLNGSEVAVEIGKISGAVYSGLKVWRFNIQDYLKKISNPSSVSTSSSGLVEEELYKALWSQNIRRKWAINPDDHYLYRLNNDGTRNKDAIYQEPKHTFGYPGFVEDATLALDLMTKCIENDSADIFDEASDCGSFLKNDRLKAFPTNVSDILKAVENVNPRIAVLILNKFKFAQIRMNLKLDDGYELTDINAVQSVDAWLKDLAANPGNFGSPAVIVKKFVDDVPKRPNLMNYLKALRAYVNAVPQTLNPEIPNKYIGQVGQKISKHEDKTYGMYPWGNTRHTDELINFSKNRMNDNKMQFARLGAMIRYGTAGSFGLGMGLPTAMLREPRIYQSINPYMWNSATLPLGQLSQFGGLGSAERQQIIDKLMNSSSFDDDWSSHVNKFGSGLFSEMVKSYRDMMKGSNLALSQNTDDKISKLIETITTTELEIATIFKRILFNRQVFLNSQGNINLNLLPYDDTKDENAPENQLYKEKAEKYKDLASLNAAVKKYNIRSTHFIKLMEVLAGVLADKMASRSAATAPGQRRSLL